jgi:hypothetical protein
MPIVFRNYGGNYQNAQSSFIFPFVSPVTINSVAAGSTGTGLIAGVVASDVSNGTAVTNGITYSVYSFQPGTGRLPAASSSSQATYTVNCSCPNTTTIYVLAVGGGGSGSSSAGGGGGGGGVVMNSVSLPAGATTISIAVGAGGASVGNGIAGVTGTNSTVSFSSSSSYNIIAYGGGGGQAVANTTSTSGGSSGGWGWGTTGASTGFPSPPLSQYNNFGNQQGAAGGGSNSYAGGGGGAGTCGVGANGGSGIQCFLPGIATFAPSGTPYGGYFWAGGGGGFSGSASYASGNGGVGGGGAGTNSASGTVGLGGVGGLNTGGGGGTGNGTNTGTGGGAAGTNTGSGGGGTYTNYSGAGGSGIVVIAFPSSSAVSSNQSATLSSSVISSNLYNAVLNNATLTSLTYNTIRGAYATRLLNYNYFGPIITLRYSTDSNGNYATNFYADICGNLGTGYLGTGQSVSSWLRNNGANTTYAFVTKWYDQGMDISFNSAYQNTTGYQPIYDVSYGVVNFGYTGGTGTSAPNTAYLNLPLNAFPVLDSSFTVVTKYWNYGTNNSDTQGDLIDIVANNQGGAIKQNTNGSPGMWLVGASNPTGTALGASNQVLTYKYTSFTTIGNNNNYVIYQNSTQTATLGRTTAFSTAQYLPSIGNRENSYYANTGLAGNPSYYLQAQLYYLYMFGSALTDADRALIEGTQSLFAPLPAMVLTPSAITTTSFTVSWTAVANATTYAMYINGSAYGMVTSGTSITPGNNGPWDVNVYAYNASYNLLASGYRNIASSINATALNVYSWYNPANVTVTGGYVTAVNDSLNNYSLVNNQTSTNGAGTVTLNSGSTTLKTNLTLNGNTVAVIQATTAANTATEFFAAGSLSSSFNASSTLVNTYAVGSAYCVVMALNCTADNSNYQLPTIFGDTAQQNGLRTIYKSGGTYAGLNNADFTYGTGGAFYLNGVQIQSGNSLVGVPSALPTGWLMVSVYAGQNTPITRFMLLGGQTYGPGIRPFGGYIGDVFVINSSNNGSFTPAKQQILEGYLGYKYGIQSSLPVTHPYYSATNSIPVTLNAA